MKTVILFISTVLLSLGLCAQQTYEVLRTKGDVSWKHPNEESWHVAKANTTVADSDIVNVGRNSEAYFLDHQSGRVYVSNQYGQMTVCVRVEKAMANSQSTFRSLNKHLFKSVSKKDKGNQAYVSYAGTYRSPGSPIEYTFYDSVYSYILTTIKRDGMPNAGSIVTECVNMSDGVFALKITNNSSRMLYFNLLLVQDDRISVCYLDDVANFIPIEPSRTVDLSSFMLSRKSGRYVVVASEKNLSVATLEGTFSLAPQMAKCDNPGIVLEELK